MTAFCTRLLFVNVPVNSIDLFPVAFIDAICTEYRIT